MSAILPAILGTIAFALIAATGLCAMWRMGPRFEQWSERQYGPLDKQ
jgi:hypothetical protein